MVAQWSRLLLVAGYLVPVIGTFVSQRPDLDSLQTLLPHAWGSVRILACTLMTVDSLTALFTILITRTND